jgi:hypothetical protein
MKKILLNEAEKKAIILEREKAIVKAFAKTFNTIKRVDENELTEERPISARYGDDPTPEQSAGIDKFVKDFSDKKDNEKKSNITPNNTKTSKVDENSENTSREPSQEEFSDIINKALSTGKWKYSDNVSERSSNMSTFSDEGFRYEVNKIVSVGMPGFYSYMPIHVGIENNLYGPDEIDNCYITIISEDEGIHYKIGLEEALSMLPNDISTKLQHYVIDNLNYGVIDHAKEISDDYENPIR